MSKRGKNRSARSVVMGPIRPCVEELEGRRLLTAVPVGVEFQVNTFTPGYQQEARVATDADGDFVITWSSFPANLTAAQDGSGHGAFAQRYNAAGVAQGNEFRVNTYTTNKQYASSVAMDSDGDFVIVWMGEGVGDNVGVFMQRYNAAGSPQGIESSVNSYTTGNQSTPDVAMDAAGNYVVTWDGDGPGGTLNDVYARLYTSDGTPRGDQFRVNTYITGNQEANCVAMNSAGDFVVAWRSNSQDGDSFGVFAQRYDAEGVPQGSEFQVSSYTTGNQNFPSIAMNSATFVIAWRDNAQEGVAGGLGIYARRYNSDGAPIGSEFHVNTYTTSDQENPSVAMDSAGDFVVTWYSVFQGPNGAPTDIYAQQYDSSGAAQGSEFRVNTYITDSQVLPSVAMDAEGDFVVAWYDGAQDGSYTSTYAQRFAAAPAVTAALFQFDIAPQRLIFTFDHDVSASLSLADITLQKLPGGIVPTLTMLPYGTDGPNTATFSFNSLLVDGNYRATLQAAGISRDLGAPMTADHLLDFFVLGGDGNHDRIVDVRDLVILANNWLGTGKTFSQADFDYNGYVDQHDLGIMAQHWQERLDLPAVPAPPVPTSPPRRAPARAPTRVIDLVN